MMKIWRFISFLLLVLVVPLAWALDPFKPADIFPDQLPGTWSCTIGAASSVVTFHKDQTFSGELRQNGQVIDRYEGTWEIKPESNYGLDVYLVWTYSKSRRAAAGQKDRDTIEILNSKLLVIWNRARQRHAYRRVLQQPAHQTR